VERDPHRPHCCGYADDADPQVPFCSSFGRARRSRRHRRSIEDIIAQIRHILARHFPHHETSRVTHSLLVFFLRAFHDRILVCCSSSVLDLYVIYLTTKENSFSQVFFFFFNSRDRNRAVSHLGCNVGVQAYRNRNFD
jgi:hypothetical protein